MKLKTDFDFNERQQRLYETLIFLGKMLFFGTFLHAVLYLRPDTYGLQSLLAGASNFFLGLVGVTLEQQGPLLIGESSSYLVTQDCLGWKSMFAFSALVLSSVPWREIENHIKPVLIGVAGIALVNLFRVVTTVYLSYFNIISFEIIHTIFWKWGLTFIVLVFWILWLRESQELNPKSLLNFK